MRVTNPIFNHKENHIFVFGSNEAGRHGKGSAYYAAEKCGAIEGIGFGLQGQSFGIPTRNKHIKTLAIVQIKYFVDHFITFAKRNPQYTFHVVEIGCTNAGYEPKDIAPLFKDAIDQENVYLPKRFWEVLTPAQSNVDTSDYEFNLHRHWKDDESANDYEFNLHQHWKSDEPDHDGIRHFDEEQDYDGIRHFRD